MATTHALAAVCNALSTLLDDAAAQPAPLGFGLPVEVDVVASSTIASISDGVGILPYRVEVCGTYRHPRGRARPDGTRPLDDLPVDLRFLVLVNAEDSATKLDLAGWVLRTIEDHPVVPLGLLNQDGAVFGLDETVEVCFDDLPHEELLHLWEALAQPRYDVVALPYVARNVTLESRLDARTHREVQERLHRFGTLAEAST